MGNASPARMVTSVVVVVIAVAQSRYSCSVSVARDDKSGWVINPLIPDSTFNSNASKLFGSLGFATPQRTFSVSFPNILAASMLDMVFGPRLFPPTSNSFEPGSTSDTLVNRDSAVSCWHVATVWIRWFGSVTVLVKWTRSWSERTSGRSGNTKCVAAGSS